MLTHAELQPLAHGSLESGRLGRDFVFTWRQKRNRIGAGGFGNSFRFRASTRLDGENLRLGDGSALGIGNGAAESAAKFLCRQCRRKQKDDG